MDDRYSEIQIHDIFPDFNPDEFNKILARTVESKPNKETIDYLLEELSLVSDDVANKDIFLRNYIYCMVITRKHLLEIDSRIKTIKQKKNCIGDKESYAFRKLKYFEKKNESAKEQITNFICNGLISYIVGRNDKYSDLINRHDEEKMWLLGPTYDYQYNSKYYNPEYDFSTFTKFYNIPGVPIFESFQQIDDIIELKRNSIEDYYLKIKTIVESKNLLHKMLERVSKNFHIHERKEIFETLLALFTEKKYLAFVVNATIQLEGMFYELIAIKTGSKEKQGTLVEKVEKAFEKNPILMQTLYPYFAFDVPDLRNQVAHKGIVDNVNIEMLAYELVLDLNCIVTLVEQESIDKFKIVLMIRDKLNEVEATSFDNDEDYYKEISEVLFCELFRNYMFISKYFWSLISEPHLFDDELNYYIPNEKSDDEIYLKDTVYALSRLCRKEEFWETVLGECKKISSINKNNPLDIGEFIRKLKNQFISKLSGKSKSICCQINQILQTIDNHQ